MSPELPRNIFGNFKYYVILVLTFQTLCNDADSQEYLPLWTWECINDRCVPTQVTSTSKLQSLQMCNMLCASMQLWPQPTGPVSLSSTAVPVRADLFQMQVISAPSKSVQEHLEDAFQLFRNDLHFMERRAAGLAEWRAVGVHVTVNGSADPRLRIDTDESYSLLMHPRSQITGPVIIKIYAKSFCGARHALETLQQLIWPDPYAGTLFMLEAAKVEDAPRFAYRGLLLDTARNFYPVQDILRTLDAMAATKLNTFHWHVSDAQAFPLKLSSVPQLANHGSYGPGATYSSDDVYKIVRRARLRGIRVVMEVDTPAHVGCGWGWGPAFGFDELLLCANTEDWFNYCREPPCGHLNPKNVHVFDILEAVYAEILQMTDVDDIFHLGGDDVSEACWSNHFEGKNFDKLWTEYTSTVLQRLESANGQLPNLTIFWASQLSNVIQNHLSGYVPSVGFQMREPYAARGDVLRFRTILSDAEAWDLNSGRGEWYEGVNGAPYNSWQRMYEHRPWKRGMESQNILGAEATVWSSMLSVAELDARLWPRAAAFAERVWSDRAEGATRAVHVRLDIHRARLVSRGINAAPIWSTWCSHHTYTCG